MIYIASFNDLKNCSFGFIDEVWVIVRSLKGGLPTFWNDDGTVRTDIDVYHIPQLSPSTELFHAYLNWKQQGIWSEQTFQEKYVPQFLNEMHGEEQKKFLNILYKKGQEKNILLLCYCTDEALCHRSIVLGLIQGAYNGKVMGYNDPDYSHYYNEYKKLDNKFRSNFQSLNFKRDTHFYLLVAGSRGFNDYATLEAQCDKLIAARSGGKQVVIVEGGARGADELAGQYAKNRGYELVVMKADWDKFGKSAGYRRNEAMHLKIASCTGDNDRACICFWDGESRGTKHNFMLAEDYKNPIFVYGYPWGKYYSKQQVAEYAAEVRKQNARYIKY